MHKITSQFKSPHNTERVMDFHFESKTVCQLRRCSVWFAAVRFCCSNLRADILSQLLCYSNVMSASTVAVVESCQGLVLGSVMERLGGR